MATAAHLLSNNVPVQMLKDIGSLKILHAEGGIFADVDMLWLGRPVPVTAKGYIFSQEAYHRPPGQTLSRRVVYSTLAVLAMPAGSVHAASLASRMLKAWAGHATAVKAKHTTAIDWGKHHSKWMRNTRMLTDAISENSDMLEGLHPPLLVFPWRRCDLETAAGAECASVNVAWLESGKTQAMAKQERQHPSLQRQT